MAGITVSKLTPMFGVEVSGLEPRVPFDPATVETLRALFDRHSLLVFRDLDVDIRFQTYLSEILRGVDVADPDKLPIKDDFRVSNREEKAAAPFGRLLYHCDQMWSAKDRVDVLSLYGAEVGQPTTPTLFVSAVEGWDTLPEGLRAQVQDRFALQNYDAETFRKRAAGDPDVLVSVFKTGEHSVRTPIAYRHPRTGRTILYVAQQTTQLITDMPAAESEALLDALFDHLYAPAKQYAHPWRQHDLVVWDNLALQHARPNVTIEGPARTLRKTFAPMPKSTNDGPAYASAALGR
jgi:alpha-ketoglutarate-dependent taurine dioxygenase